MFGNLVQRLQSLSPLGSPVTSPVSSPKTSRRHYKSPKRGPRRPPLGRHKEEYREVQSDPELDEADNGKKFGRTSRHLLDKRKNKSRGSAARTVTEPGINNNIYAEHKDFAPLQGSKSLGRLDGLKEVQRLAQYEQYFQSILCESRHDHADHDDISKAKARAKQAVKRGQEESDLERIQDLFPNDCLRLYDRDVVTMKMKGLIRKRSTTAARLQRALSAKALRPGTGDCSGDPASPQSPNRDQGLPRTGQDKRQFLMEAPVQFTTGVQSQERHLFLFNDLLLVAKARSGGNFKLKEKVRVSELWLTRVAMPDVIEVNKSFETSFVMGWPTTNVVATFSTQAARDLWWGKLNEVLDAEKDKEPRSTNIQVLYYDCATSIEYCKTFSVGPEETARTCIRLALEHLEMRGLDPDDFQLWAKTAREESPYPLIGHERPFAIKLSCLRDGLSTEEGFDLDHCNNVHGPDPLAKCQFILRSKRKASDCSNSSIDSKKGLGVVNSNKKARKSPMRIRQVFKRSISKGEDLTDSPSGPSLPAAAGVLFGIPLNRLGDPDIIPRPVMPMLQQVFTKGPFTQGIFRKSANARLVKELRERLDSGLELAFDHIPVLAVAALLKEFLRSLPDPLLGSALYPLYMEALECRDEQEKLIRVKSVLEQLPQANVTLLSHFLCVLHHIARRASQNLMSAANLGVCVGPSLLWAHTPTPASSRAVPSLVELLVARCELLLGPHVPLLLGDPPERDPTRQDSGAEESDSLHCGLRRDDSSIDSLERELLEPCPPPRKDKMSLSRDSGLTMSDSQLYTPDEEESGSTSSGSGRALYPPAQQSVCYDIHSHAKVTSSYSVPAATSTPTSRSVPEVQSVIGSAPTREYVRVYGGWEERVQECCNRSPWSEDSIYARPVQHQPQSTSSQVGVINPNFQRQDWFRQRSHLKRLNSGGSGSGGSGKSTGNHMMSGSSSGSASSNVGGLHTHAYRGPGPGMRRSASDESLLNDTTPEQHAYEEHDVVGLLKRPALHRKGRAPAPPPPVPTSSPPETRESPYSCYAGTPMLRSKSAHLLCEAETPTCAYVTHESPAVAGTDVSPSHCKTIRVTPPEDWSRSRSTPHIATSADDVDRSYDSSTLSDDDSTPHVSRSNSRGKDCAAANSAWESAYGSSPAPELLVHAAPVNIHEESCSDSEQQAQTAPPLPPKRSSADVKLRHLPPVHVDNPAPRHSATPEEVTWEGSEVQTRTRKAPERKGRLRHRNAGARTSQRSKSLPPPPGESRPESVEEVGGTSAEVRNHPTGLRGEISWSVSQLRSLFADNSRPPPYRPPPNVIPSHRAPITSYHLGNSQSERYVLSRRLLLDTGPRLRGLDSTDEEESYV
ncbi:uncharacterized protein [Periplaneta americana]|uniref:uncharacterized protein isoform X2 n=1 Tax=Periplaneta americana TaxID=6978 RepID=UPI0037E8EB6D